MVPVTSRRRAISYIGMGVVAATNLSGCCCIRKILGNPCTDLEKWKNERRKWWYARKQAREVQRKAEIAIGLRPDLQIPYPYLVCWRSEDPVHGPIIDQIRNIRLNQRGDLYVMIENQGNVPSWLTVVESYEGPAFRYNIPFTEMTLNDRVIVNAMPGQSLCVKIGFTPTRPSNGGIVIRSYDPLSDPMPLTYEQYDRHNNGFGWSIFNP
jgi:hypothetical protein